MKIGLMGEPAHSQIGFKRVRTSPQVLCKSMNEMPAQQCSTTISPWSICCDRQWEPTCTVLTHQGCLDMDNGCPGSQFANKVILQSWTVHLATLNRLSLLEAPKWNLKRGENLHVCVFISFQIPAQSRVHTRSQEPVWTMSLMWLWFAW